MVQGAWNQTSHVMGDGVFYGGASEPVHEAELKDHEPQILTKGDLWWLGKFTERIAYRIEIVYILG